MRLTFLLPIIAIVFVLPLPVKADATAVIYAASPAGSAYIGERIGVTLYVKSTEEPMNAVEGSLLYDPQFFDFIEIEKSGSVISLWIIDPIASAGSSTIAFAGTALNPGYQGIGGKVFTVYLRAKQVGSPFVALSGAKILANDGLGTDITAGQSGVSINVVTRPLPEPEPIAEEAAPSQPSLQSQPATGGEQGGDAIAIKTQELLGVLLDSQLPEQQAQVLLDRIPDELLQRSSGVQTLIIEKEKEVQRYRVITQAAAATNVVTLIFTLVSWTRVLQLKRLLNALKLGSRIVSK